MTGTLYRVSCTLLSRQEDREDAVQAAICRAWERIDTLKKPLYFQTWLIRILINECYGLLRQGSRVVCMAELPEQPAQEPDRERSLDLTGAVASLDEKLRLPVVLYYAEGYSIREIAQLLEASESAIKMRLLRARDILRERLNEEDESI